MNAVIAIRKDYGSLVLIADIVEECIYGLTGAIIPIRNIINKE